MCIKSNASQPVLSVCDAQVFNDEANDIEFKNHIAQYSILDFEKIRPNSIIKGWVHRVTKEEVLLHAALNNFNGFAQLHYTVSIIYYRVNIKNYITYRFYQDKC